MCEYRTDYNLLPPNSLQSCGFPAKFAFVLAAVSRFLSQFIRPKKRVLHPDPACGFRAAGGSRAIQGTQTIAIPPFT
jgi:hypothetical protein